MLVTYYDAYCVLTKVYSDGAYIKQALNDTVIEEKNRNQTTKICYGVLDKDVTLSYIIKKLCDKSPKLAIRTILKIALYSLKYLGTAPHAVCNTAVELIKKLGKGGTSGFVNAVLRKYIRDGVILPNDDSVLALSINYSYPEFAVKRLINDYGIELAKQIMSADKEHTFIRFNKGENGEDYLTKLNKNYQKTQFNSVFLVENFKMDEGFYEGKYTFQSVGSVAICNLVIDGDSVSNLSSKNLLDTCSAPGGKAVYLAEYFNSVTACDVHEHRVSLINSYASRMNKNNVTAMLLDATEFNSEFSNKFDYVLCDAPCSGYGVIKDNPDIKLNRTEDSIDELSSLQLKILNNASKYVKKGGYLCYSTCSIFRQENDEVIKKFLQNNSEFECEITKSPLPNLTFDYGNAFLPHLSLGAGFYFAKLKRV